MILVIVGFILVLVLGTFSYAFFNYTRTGSTNNIRVGRINFESSQNNTINLSDVFPTDSSHLDNTNSSTVTINITGDTNYEDGIEYKVSIDQVTNTVNNKEVPISFSVTASNLGTKSSDYYNERGSTTNVFNLRESGTATNGQDIVIGYIKPDENGVNGSINITAFIDKDKIAISDTVSTIVNDNLVYGETPGNWIGGRTVLTTTEWNSLSTNGVSFKVKVEANEGLWVDEPELYVLKVLNDISEWTNIRGSITSVEFSTNSEIPSTAVTSFDATDLTSTGPVTVYTLDDGLSNNTYKAVISADDIIYAPEDSSAMFFNCTNLTSFNSNNFILDNVRVLNGFFALDSNLSNVIGLANWNTSRLEHMKMLFYGCSQLDDIMDLANWDTSHVIDMNMLFYNCSHVNNINALVNWDTSNVEIMSGMFTNNDSYNPGYLDATPLANWDTSSVTEMTNMFFNRDIQSYLPFKNWDVSSVENFSNMFNGTSNSTITTLEGLDNWDVSSATNMSSMFQDNFSLTDASAINNWNINANIDFTDMFHSTPVHPEFTQVQGTWDSDGTFTPTP